MTRNLQTRSKDEGGWNFDEFSQHEVKSFEWGKSRDWETEELMHLRSHPIPPATIVEAGNCYFFHMVNTWGGYDKELSRWDDLVQPDIIVEE